MNLDMYLLILVYFIISLLIFVVLIKVIKFAAAKIKSSSRFKSFKLFNLEEYLPMEQVTEIRQIFFLSMIVLFSLNILYLLVYGRDMSLTLVFIDIILSFYIAFDLDTKSKKDKLLILLLVPFNSMILISGAFIYPLDILHAIPFIYFIKVYYDKFMEYTETNSLGITIMLLFIIVFFSFLFTIFVEDVSPLDSLVMVSNAFTSNGYAVLGKSSIGKINAIFLVWSGFILSGVATATLTVAIVMKHVNEKFDKLEKLAKKNKKN
nr:hypothetical protein [uncultured Methanobrevibacter sp.]